MLACCMGDKRTGTGCPQRQCSLLLGDLQKPSAWGLGDPALSGAGGTGVGPQGPNQLQRSYDSCHSVSPFSPDLSDSLPSQCTDHFLQLGAASEKFLIMHYHYHPNH